MTSDSPSGYNVARINKALGKRDQAGFALATVMNGKALWEEAAKHGPGTSAPQDPETIPRLDKVDTSSPHLVAIDGPITVHGDSFIVPIQSEGERSPYGWPSRTCRSSSRRSPMARTPGANAADERLRRRDHASPGGAADALTGMAPACRTSRPGGLAPLQRACAPGSARCTASGSPTICAAPSTRSPPRPRGSCSGSTTRIRRERASSCAGWAAST